MARLKSLEKNRLQNINFVMEDIHNLTNEIYENLVDKDYDPLRNSIKTLIKTLKGLEDSIKDEL